MQPSEIKFAANMALLTAIGYIIGFGAILLRPEAQRIGPTGANATDFYPSFVSNPTLSMIVWYAGFVTSIIAIGFLPTLAKFLKNEKNKAQINFGKNVAIVTYALSAAWWITIAGYTMRVADVYSSSPRASQQVFEVYAFGGFDPDGILIFGLLAFWLFIMNYYGQQDGALSRTHAVIGYVAALTSLCAVASIIINSLILRLLAVFSAIVLFPTWLIMLRMKFKETLS